MLYKSIDEMSPENKEKVIRSERLKDMVSNNDGWKEVRSYLMAMRNSAKNALEQMDVAKQTPEEAKTNFIVLQEKINLYTSVLTFIETTISEGENIKLKLLQDNARKEV